jgi:DNA-binding CsgD family transcriptional regulator
LGNQGLQKIDDSIGYWTFSAYKNYMLAGSYNGVKIFQRKAGEWSLVKNIAEIKGSITEIVIKENDDIWLHIPNYAITKLRLDDSLNVSLRENEYLEEYELGAFRLDLSDEKLHLVSKQGTYMYDEDRRILVVVEENSKKQNFYNIQFPDLLLNDFYRFHPVYNGFLLEDRRIKPSYVHANQHVLIRDVEFFNTDSLAKVIPHQALDYTFNNVRVRVEMPFTEAYYQMKNTSSVEWSSPQKSSVFEFIDLKPGKHELQFRAKIQGQYSKPVSLPIKVNAPWYKTKVAYLFYCFIVLGLIVLFLYWRKRSLDQQKMELLAAKQNSLQQQEVKHQKYLQQLENERMQLAFEELKNKLKNKTLELAAKAKEYDDINQLFVKVTDTLKYIQQHPNEAKKHTGELLKLINKELSIVDNTFETQLDELHQEFYEKVKKRHPELTSSDLRLCAHIRSGFNAKEIADLLSIKPSSVYISRSRLRKKLNLDKEEDLYSYLTAL